MSPENNKSKLDSSGFLDEQQNFLDQVPFYDFIEQILEKTNKPIETFEDFTKVLKVIRFATWEIDPSFLRGYSLRRYFIKEIVSIFPSADIVKKLADDIHTQIEQTPYLTEYIHDFWVKRCLDIRGEVGIYNNFGQHRKPSGGNSVTGERHLDRFPTYLSYAQKKITTSQITKFYGLEEDSAKLGFIARLPDTSIKISSPKHFFRLIDSEALK